VRLAITCRVVAACWAATVPSAAAAQDCNANGIVDGLDVPTPVLAEVLPGETLSSLRRRGDLLIVGGSSAHVMRIDPGGALQLLGTVASTKTGAVVDAAFHREGAFFLRVGALEYADLTDPATATVTSSTDVSGVLQAVRVSGSYVHVVSLAGELRIFDATNLAPVGSVTFPTGPQAFDLEIRGHVAWVATTQGLHAVDVSTPTAPVTLGVTSSIDVRNVELDGNRAVASGVGGLFLFDVSDPTQPGPLAQVPGAGDAALELDGDTVYAGSSTQFEAWTLRDPANPRRLWSAGVPAELVVLHGGYTFLGRDDEIRSLRVRNALGAPVVESTTAGVAEARAGWAADGNVAFLANGVLGLDVWDVTRPFDPQPVGEWEPMPPVSEVLDLEPHGDWALAVDSTHGLLVFDVSEPACPTLAATLALAGGAVALDVDGRHAYCVDPSQGLVIVDVSDPLLPAVVGMAGLSGQPEDVLVEAGRAYLFESISMQILDVEDPSAPAVLHAEASAPGAWRGGALYGHVLARVSDSVLDPGIAVYDVSDPSGQMGQPLTRIGATIPLLGAEGVTLDGSVLHVATGTAGVASVELRGTESGPQLLDQDAVAGIDPIGVTRHGEWLFTTDALGAVASLSVTRSIEGDCDANGVPDSCDIAAGSVPDANGNGVPDGCESPPPGLACQPLDFSPPAGASILLASTDVQRVSLRDGGGEIFTTAMCSAKTKNNAHPTISDDGTIVAFSSDSPNVLGFPNTGGKRQAYAHFVPTKKTILVSGTSSNGPGNGFSVFGNANSDYPVVSGDGSVIAYYSSSTNLSPLDPPGGNGVTDIYLYDVSTGTTELVSSSPMTGLAASGVSSGYTAVSTDGRFVAFQSRASDLVDPVDYGGLQPVSGQWDVFLLDRGGGGSPRTIEWLSVGRDGQGGFVVPNGDSQHPAMSRDGCRVVYDSYATNLSPEGSDLDGSDPRIWVVDRGTDGLDAGDPVFDPCGSAPPGDMANFDEYSQRPDISGDGKWIVFESAASNLVTAQQGDDVVLPDDNGLADVFLLEVDTGAVQRIDVTQYPSSAPPGQTYPEAPHALARISGSGRFVVFTSSQEDFDCAGDGIIDSKNFRLYCLDRDVDGDGSFDGATEMVRLSDAPHDMTPGIEADDYAGGNAAITADGRYVVFMSESTDFAVGEQDTNGTGDDSLCPQGGCSPPSRWGRDIFRRRVW